MKLIYLLLPIINMIIKKYCIFHTIPEIIQLNIMPNIGTYPISHIKWSVIHKNMSIFDNFDILEPVVQQFILQI